MFTDRIDAGLQLAQKLQHYKHEDAVVLAIPRGGVPIGFMVASALKLPLDIVLTKKIGHPNNNEYAIGAVSPTDRYIIPHDDVSIEYIDEQTQLVRKKLQEMHQQFKGEIPAIPIRNKTIIIVDDGIATGNTLMVTLRMLRKNNPKKIVIAVPVSSYQAKELLINEADEFVCLQVPPFFGGVGAFYENFTQVSDEAVKQYLQQFDALQK